MELVRKVLIAATSTIVLGTAAFSDTNEELAKKLSNPISSLISVPLEFHYDQGFGPDGDGTQKAFIAKPVVPFSISEDWNVISRTILYYAEVDNVTPGSSLSGTGDILQSFFSRPKS